MARTPSPDPERRDAGRPERQPERRAEQRPPHRPDRPPETQASHTQPSPTEPASRPDGSADPGPKARPARGKGAVEPALERERQIELDRLGRLARTLDARYRIPLTPFRIGADGLIGLIPGVGDTLAALPSAYMILRGWQLGARRRTVGRMAVNTGIDYVIGTVPIVGDLFDIGFKGNLRNIRLLEREFGREARLPEVDDPGDHPRGHPHGAD